MPFDILDRSPRIPVWDAILLLLAGTIVILGADAQTESITDPAGNDLDGFGERVKQVLQRGSRPEECFFGYKGFDGAKGIIAGELLLQMGHQSSLPVSASITSDPSLIAHLPIRELLADRALRSLARELATEPEAREAIAERSIAHVLADPAASRRLSTSAVQILQAAAGATKRGDFVHKVAGVRGGSLRYAMKHGLNEMELSGPIAASERNEVRVRDIATSKWSVGVGGDRNKRMKLVFESKLGTGRDHVRTIVEELPLSAARGIEMNLRPGLGGMDIMTEGGPVEMSMTIQTRIRDQTVQRRFAVPVEGGLRLNLTNLLSESTLKTSEIERLFGPGKASRVLQPR